MIPAILSRGSHLPESSRRCLLENIAFLAGEEHSDHPQCVSPILGVFGRAVNDLLGFTERQELRQYEYLMMGTRDDGKDRARVQLCVEFAQKMAPGTSLTFAENKDEAKARAAVSAVVENVSKHGYDSVPGHKIYEELIAFLGILIKGGE